MYSTAARGLIVTLLLLATAVTGVAAAPPAEGPAAAPDIGTLVAGTEWRIREAYPAAFGNIMAYQQSWVSSPGGADALLFVGATSRPVVVFRWTGELGFLGDGYTVERAWVEPVKAGSGIVAANHVRLRRGADRLEVVSAVVRPDGVFARGTDSPLALGWDALAHRGAPYYAIRVTIHPDANGGADARAAPRLLSAALSRLASSER